MNNALRTVALKGIQFRDRYYFSPKLKKVLNQKVIIKFTEVNDKYIYVFTSDDVQKINSETMLHKIKGNEIINRLEFVCMAEEVPVYGYGDPAYKEKFNDQRQEEKQLKIASSITKITGFEANIHEINKDVEEIITKNSNTKKLKDSWDD